MKFCSAFLLIGCVSSCGGVPFVPPQDTLQPSPTIWTPTRVLDDFNEKLRSVSDLVRSDLSASDLEFQADFEGEALFQQLGPSGVSSTDLLRAEFSLNAIISGETSNISGSFNQFVTGQGGSAIGELQLIDGKFDLATPADTDFHFTGRVEGELTLPGSIVRQVDGVINGDLLGSELGDVRGETLLIFGGSGNNIQYQGRFASF